MTLKQKRFVNEYLAKGNGTKAAIKAGYSPKRADQQAYENLRKPEIQKAIHDRLNGQGITEDFLIQKVKEGLEAYTVKAVSLEGKIIDERSYPNFAVRWKYLDTALKLRGMYPSEKHEYYVTDDERIEAEINRREAIRREAIRQQLESNPELKEKLLKAFRD